MKNTKSFDQAHEPLIEQLTALRNQLLKLHKILLDAERAAYERLHGAVSAGDLLRLLLNHPRFAWLRVLSDQVVLIDELLDADEPVPGEDARKLVAEARKLQRPAELGEEFAQKYQAALQQEPDVVLAHQKLREILKQES
jgi:hypothetical protein